MRGVWSAEEDDAVREGLRDRVPSSVTALALGRTRNMVIGRRRSLGLRYARVRIVPCAVEAPPPDEPPEPEFSPPLAVRLVDAGPHQCRWPLWDEGGGPDYRCCGRPGYPYCEAHSARAFGKAAQERRFIAGSDA